MFGFSNKAQVKQAKEDRIQLQRKCFDSKLRSYGLPEDLIASTNPNMRIEDFVMVLAGNYEKRLNKLEEKIK